MKEKHKDNSMTDDSQVLEKTCFIICPLGDNESETRWRSDKVMEQIIKPALVSINRGKCFRIKELRSDKDDVQGNIITQITRHLLSSDIVIADMSDGNPNVFFEMGVRDKFGPLIPILCQGQDIRFDFAHQRAIKYKHFDPASMMECSRQLKDQILSILVDGAWSPIFDYDHGFSPGGGYIERWKMLNNIFDAVRGVKNDIDSLRNFKDEGKVDEYLIRAQTRQSRLKEIRESKIAIPLDWRINSGCELFRYMKEAEDDEKVRPYKIGEHIEIEMHTDSPYNGKLGVVDRRWRRENHYFVKFEDMDEKAFHVMYLGRIEKE